MPTEKPRAAAIRTPKSESRARASLHGSVRRHEEPVLVLGATGSFGAAVANALIEKGERARLFVRDTNRAVDRFGGTSPAEFVRGDAQDTKAVVRAAQGCRAIVHAVSYPLGEWSPNMPAATANVVEAAKSAGVPILFPGNVWGLARSDDGGPITEKKAQNAPRSEPGRVRVELEASLRVAVESQGVRVIVLRAGNFYGPTVRNDYTDRIFGRAAAGKTIRVLGRLDAKGQWAYAPDLARCALWLIDRSSALKPWQVIQFPGHVVERQRDMAELAAEAAGNEGLAIKRVPWWQVRAAALVDKRLKPLLALKDIFDDPPILDSPLLRRNYAERTQTPIERAVAATVASYRDRPRRR